MRGARPMRFGALAAIGIALAALSTGEAQDRRRGRGRIEVESTFHAEIPDHPGSVILGRPTRTSVTLSLLLRAGADAVLVWAPEGEALPGTGRAIRLAPDEPQRIVIGGLDPDTRYAYELRDAGTSRRLLPTAGPGAFHTARPAGRPFAFTVQADSHLDEKTKPEVYQRTLGNALADRPDFHIDLGDTFMTDKLRPDFRRALDLYRAQRYHLGRIGCSAPVFLVPGNHDGEAGWLADGTPDAMPVWSCRTRKRYFPNPVPDGFYTGNAEEDPLVGLKENYYAWTWGDALFVVMDPYWPTTRRSGRQEVCWNRTLGGTQYRWLRKTLEESRARFRFVFIHQLVGGADESGRGGVEAAPLYEWGGKNPDGSDGFRARRPGWETPIHALLARAGVSIVFHGHDHFYSRQELDGIVYQLVPQPASWPSRKRSLADEYGYASGTSLPGTGHLRVSVAPEKTTVTFVRACLPEDERRDRRNGDIVHTYAILPREPR